MEIIEYFGQENREYWLEQIRKSDWVAGKFLYNALREGRLKTLCGESTQVFLLTDGGALASFCTLAEQDDIPDSGLTPWVGFVYTFPAYRGRRCAGLLLDHACREAARDGAEQVWLSTWDVGLYEKYGFSFHGLMKDMDGKDFRIYKRTVR